MQCNARSQFWGTSLIRRVWNVCGLCCRSVCVCPSMMHRMILAFAAGEAFQEAAAAATAFEDEYWDCGQFML